MIGKIGAWFLRLRYKNKNRDIFCRDVTNTGYNRLT